MIRSFESRDTRIMNESLLISAMSHAGDTIAFLELFRHSFADFENSSRVITANLLSTFANLEIERLAA